MLLHRGSSFRILSVERNGGIQFVNAEYVGAVVKKSIKKAERKAEKKAAAKADAKLEGSKFVYGDDDVIRVVTEAELKAMLLPE